MRKKKNNVVQVDFWHIARGPIFFLNAFVFLVFVVFFVVLLGGKA
jgi:hypothetical protein